MGYKHFFHGDFEAWKKEFKDFGDNMRSWAAENLPHDFDTASCFRFDSREPPFLNLYHPRTNVWVDEAGTLTFEFMLAGYDERDIQLTFREDKMILKVMAPAGQTRLNPRFERLTFSLKGVDYREYAVPEDRYDQSKVKAVFKNGILTVTIPALDQASQEGSVKIEIVKEGN